MAGSIRRSGTKLATALLTTLVVLLGLLGASLAVADTVNVGVAGPILAGNTPVTVPVSLLRSSLTPGMMGFSVVFKVSTPLTLPSGKASIQQGDFLPPKIDGTSTFQIIDKGVSGGDHSYQVDGALLGSLCDVTKTTAILFNIGVAATSS